MQIFSRAIRCNAVPLLVQHAVAVQRWELHTFDHAALECGIKSLFYTFYNMPIPFRVAFVRSPMLSGFWGDRRVMIFLSARNLKSIGTQRFELWSTLHCRSCSRHGL